MIIRKFKKEDADEVYKLVSKTFKEFVSDDFSKRKTREWLEEQYPEKQIERAKTRDVYIAVINKKIVGMVEAVPHKKISRLFVDKIYHKKGVARSLLDKIEALYYKRSAKKLVVWSSLYAIKFYEKAGYSKSRGLVKKNGAIYQPMVKTLGK